MNRTRINVLGMTAILYFCGQLNTHAAVFLNLPGELHPNSLPPTVSKGIDWLEIFNAGFGKGLAGGVAVGLLVVVLRLWRLRKVIRRRSTEIGLQVVDQISQKLTGVPDQRGVLDTFYKTAFEEIQSNKVDQACWAKAFASANGHPEETKALYLKYRVSRLKSEEQS
ncbi:MAG TPA: hypothetical protein PKA57_14730 [Parvibaculum sp.]|uniref:hypothetical protein n=1 Tax=Parvibaculum sp. TaxID=2024848 RepID=UPI002BFE3E4B|nr:hypothetical protein [Parvibaculum sp.]HMM15875.1 hypothetical protein [Parvibaculum sp.]